MHLPKSLVTRPLPVPPVLEEIGTLQHLLRIKAVSPMFKGMEGRSMHIIGIIENGFNPTKCCEAILGYQLSRSFLVLIAFGNLVLCLSAPMHIDVLLGSNRLAASTSFSNPATDLKAALVAPHSP